MVNCPAVLGEDEQFELDSAGHGKHLEEVSTWLGLKVVKSVLERS